MSYHKISYTNALYILNLFGKQTNMSIALQSISNWLETLIPDAIVSIMLFSEKEQTLTLVHAKDYFSEEYKNLLKNLKIGPMVGSCGAAAYHKKMMICENLADHPNWKKFQDIIKNEEIAACWAMPMINSEGKLYGTFGTYYKQPKSPTESEIKILYEVAALTALYLDYFYEHEHKNAMYDKYHSFFNDHPAAVYEHNLNGFIIHANATSKNVNGFTSDQVVGKYFLDFIPHDHQDKVKEAFTLTKQGHVQQIKIPIYNALQQIYWAELTYMPIFQHNEITGIYAIIKNITRNYKLEQDLNLLKRSVEASPNGLTIITKDNLDYQIVYANLAFQKMTGYSKEEVLGGNCKFIQGVETDFSSVEKIRNAIKKDQMVQVTLKNYKKDGTWFWNKITLSPVFNQQNTCTHFICTQEDVTKQRLYQEHINYQQTHDQLTDLINRQTFERLLESAFQKYVAQSDRLLTVLYIDLDDLRTITQDLSYTDGDDLFKEIAQRLKLIAKDQHTLSRFSADSFALLINQSLTEEEIIIIAEKILKDLALPFKIHDHYIHLTTNIGIANATNLTTNSRELVFNAIQTMYKAKNTQMSTWQWHQDTAEKNEKINEVKLRHDLTLALEKQQFQLNYQPILNAKTKKIVAVEALIRWFHPERGFISPIQFIHLAERSGQIIPLGNWILHQACQDMMAINQNRVNPLKLSVNLSPAQFKDPYLVNQFQEVISKYNMNPALLNVEITEGILMLDTERSIKILEELKQLGIQVSIDDFGTGYSSFSYLCKFAIDQIKLDQSFIHFLPQQEKYAAIVTSIIEMAKKLQLEIVAEGVELAEQVHFLVENHCSLLQGYYFSKPVPRNELEILLKNNDLFVKKDQ